MYDGDAGLPRRDVPGAFDAGAAAYDRLVGANPGYHANLRLSARRHAAARTGPGTAGARRRLRHRRVDGRAADGGSRSRDHRRRRVTRHAGRGTGKAMAGSSAVRAQPDRRARRARHHRTVRRDPGRLPGAQSARPRQPTAAPSERCCGPAAPWPCTITRCAIPVPPRWSGTRCAGASSSPPAGGAPTIPPCTGTCGAASWRSTVPSGSGVGSARPDSPECEAIPCPAGRPTSSTPSSGTRRNDRSPPPDAPGTARAGSADALPTRPHAVVVGAGIAGLAAAAGLAERGVASRRHRTRALPRRASRRLDRTPRRH